MSRSRKKTPMIKDNNRGSNKISKRIANKTVRRYQGAIADGCSYRKIYSSYEISDYGFYWPWEEWSATYGDGPAERNLWERYYLRK